MTLSPFIGLGFLLASGLWWVLFPRSVIAMYIYWQGDPVKLPSPLKLRIAGLLWIAIVLSVGWFSRNA